MTRRKTLATLFQLAFAIALLVFLYYKGNIEIGQILVLFSGDGIWTAVMAGLLILTAIVAGGLRLALYFRSVGHEAGLLSFVRLNYVGFLMMQVLPGVTAGDVVRGYFLADHMRGRTMEGLAIMLWDRLVGLSTLVLMGLGPALALVVMTYGLDKAWPMVLLTVAAGTSLLYLATEPERISRIVRTLEIWLPVPRRLKDRRSQGRALLKSLVTNFRMNVLGILLSILVHGSTMLALIVMARALGDQTSFLHQALLIPVVILGGIIPATPGNVGWNEYVAQVAWSVLGASTMGAQAFASFRIVALLVSFPAFYWVVRSPMVRSLAIGESEVPSDPPPGVGPEDDGRADDEPKMS